MVADDGRQPEERLRRRGEGAQQAESREEKRFSDAVFHGICLFLRFV